jgi:hypothetical protein
MHLPLLDECISITSLKRLTDFDLLAASGWALYGHERGIKHHLIRKNDELSDNDVSILLFKKSA